MSSNSSPCVALRYSPSLRTNFSAFHCQGLCPAVIAMPPSAFSDVIASCMLGVGQMPRSTTSQPAANSPASTADRIIGPDGLVSRQTRIRPRSRYVPKLSAKSTASSGVKVSPTIPRTPVMPIFNGFIEVSDDLWKLGVSDLILPHDQSKCLHQKV